MLGAIIGDIVGSIYEFHNIRRKDFELFGNRCTFTDDSVMTLAIAKSIIEFFSKENKKELAELAVKNMQEMGREYPGRGYGGHFAWWLEDDNPQPYNSFGNGAAMRISSVAEINKDLNKALEMSDIVTGVTHNHPEGLKGARATVHAMFLAREKKDPKEIKKIIKDIYYPEMDASFTINNIRKTYYFNETCQNSVPQAIEAFIESTSFEDAIRNAISIGGDSDTIACITGAIAEAYYGVPQEIKCKAMTYLDDNLIAIIKNFERLKAERL